MVCSECHTASGCMKAEWHKTFNMTKKDELAWTCLFGRASVVQCSARSPNGGAMAAEFQRISRGGIATAVAVRCHGSGTALQCHDKGANPFLSNLIRSKGPYALVRAWPVHACLYVRLHGLYFLTVSPPSCSLTFGNQTPLSSDHEVLLSGKVLAMGLYGEVLNL